MARFNPHKAFLGIFIPDGVMELDLSSGAKFCYGLLLRFAGENGYCWPKQSTLAERLKVSDRQIRSYLAELENALLIEADRPGLGDTNRYYFLDDWMSMKTEDRKETSDLAGSRRETSCQIGIELPVKEEEGFLSFHKTEENQQRRESEKEESQVFSLALQPSKSGPKQNWLRDLFEVFWGSATWAKIGRGAAWSAWCKCVRTPKQGEKIIEAAILQGPLILQSAQSNGHSILHPSTWLNQGRYDDSVEDLHRSILAKNGNGGTTPRMQSINAAADYLRQRDGF